MSKSEFAWLVAGACGGALLAVVFIGWLPERARSGAPASGVPPVSAEPTSLGNAISQLDQRLARIESAMAVQASRGAREPVDASEPKGGDTLHVSPGQEGLEELHTDLMQLSKRIDALAGSLLENRRAYAEYPTLDQMHSARADVDWTFVEEVRRACSANSSTGLERVRLMTFDDLLKKVGLPTAIRADDGVWWYARPATDSRGQPTSRGIELHFIHDYVTTVVASGNE